MTNYEDVWESLESTAPIKRRRRTAWSKGDEVANPADVAAHRRVLLDFLGELDSGCSVHDIVEALEEYT